MRKLLILIGLFLTITLSGQMTYPAVLASQGAAATGPVNKISNGVFTDATGWSVSGGFTIGSGVATFDDATFGYIYQTAANMVSNLAINTAYTLTFDVTGTSGGGIYMKISTSSGGVDYKAYAQYTNGAKTVTFTTPAVINEGGIRFVGNTAGDSGGSIDNLVLTAD